MEPLAAKRRPTTLADYVGQEHLVGPGKPLYEAIKKRHLFSFILWGPPGVGKTTLARIYAEAMGADFFELSAVRAGKADIAKVVGVERAGPKILFIDEIHRFNKAQQDYLLPFVESGELTFIGATTENPSFEVISALLSRCRVFTLKPLRDEEMERIIDGAGITLSKEAKHWLINYAGGDARQALTVLEVAASLYDEVNEVALQAATESKTLRYDAHGEEHHNTISAFIKSLRASDPNAALYYLSRMTEAGEDPKFIARRMVIFASEDIGMAQPTALVVANEVFRAVETIGYPECTINLAHGVVYLATAKKDRRVYDALRAAEADVRQYGNLPIPLNLRNAPTHLMKDEGYGEGYEMYPPEGTNLLPEKIKGTRYFK
jgi:putative ATPase